MDKLYTAREVGEILHRKPCTIRDMIRRGEFGETYNDGREHLIYESELKAHMSRKTGPATTYVRNLGGGRQPKKTQYIPKKLSV